MKKQPPTIAQKFFIRVTGKGLAPERDHEAQKRAFEKSPLAFV